MANQVAEQEAQQRADDEAKEAQRVENERKAQALRARLIAQRQQNGTPIKAAANARVETPIPGSGLQQTAATAAAIKTPQSSDSLGLDSLLAEGMAAAAAAKAGPLALPEQVVSRHPQPQILPFEPTTNGQNNTNELPHPLPANSQIRKRSPPRFGPLADIAPSPARPTGLSSAYYADLPAWLELTGYHDLLYRESKLSTYKERKSLEDEAARIHARLEALKQEEAAEIAALRAQIAHPASGITAPALPIEMPARDTAVANGIKRAHSPDLLDRTAIARTRREDEPNGFRIRGGANPSPRAGSPPELGKPSAYPNARRRSSDYYPPSALHSRDPSLERRQASYTREGAARDYDAYVPARDNRDMRPSDRSRQYGNGAGAAQRGGFRGEPGGGGREVYRGHVGLDNRKGGQMRRVP